MDRYSKWTGNDIEVISFPSGTSLLLTLFTLDSLARNAVPLFVCKP